MTEASAGASPGYQNEAKTRELDALPLPAVID